MYNPVPAIGSASLGIVIGWLVRYFIRRFDKFTPSVLGTIISLAFGGVAVKFLDADRTAVWFYPIGVLLGFAIYQTIVMRALDKEFRNNQLKKVAGSGGRSGGGFGDKHQPDYDRIRDND